MERETKPLVSVIVPVYNVEAYLDKCLQSVLVQTHSNLEIILVDDGSIDASGQMCDGYADKDSRIKVIHKENGGLSDARNAALDIMSGEYVTFIDSDDYVDRRLIERLLACITEQNADLTVGGFVKTIAEIEDERNLGPERREQVITARDAMFCMFYRKGFPTYAHGKLYRSSLFEHIRFPVGKLFEDIITVYQVLCVSGKIGIVDYPMYYYRQRRESIINSTFKPSRLDAVEHALKMLQDVSADATLKKAAEGYLFFILMDNYALVDKTHAKEKTYLEMLIRKHRRGVVCNLRVPWSLRILAVVSWFPGMRFARFLGRVYKNKKQQKWIKEAAKKA